MNFFWEENWKDFPFFVIIIFWICCFWYKIWNFIQWKNCLWWIKVEKIQQCRHFQVSRNSSSNNVFFIFFLIYFQSRRTLIAYSIIYGISMDEMEDVSFWRCTHFYPKKRESYLYQNPIQFSIERAFMIALSDSLSYLLSNYIECILCKISIILQTINWFNINCQCFQL